MIKKIDVLKGFIDVNEWDKAICYAAKFQNLGSHDKAIRKAAGAINNPRFYEQIGGNIDALKNYGIDALKERYCQ